MTNLNFKLTGLTCESCIKVVSNLFKKIPGVCGVSIDLASGDTVVSSEVELDLKTIEKILEGTHYSIIK